MREQRFYCHGVGANASQNCSEWSARGLVERCLCMRVGIGVARGGSQRLAGPYKSGASEGAVSVPAQL